MKIDRIKLARMEMDAGAAQAVFERLRDDLSEARLLEAGPLFHLRKLTTGAGRKWAHLHDLLSDLDALAAAAEECGAPHIAKQARIVLERKARVSELELAVAEAQQRYHSLSATARKCLEFANSVDGIPRPSRPPALAPRF